MRLFLSFVPALGCAGAMVVCVQMMRGRDGAKASPEPPPTTAPNEKTVQQAEIGTGPAPANR